MPFRRASILMLCLLGAVALAAPQEPTKLEAKKEPRLDRNGDPLPEGAIARLKAGNYRPTGLGISTPVLFSDGSSVTAIGFSDNGKLVIAASKDGSIQCWDPETFEIRKQPQINISNPVRNPLLSKNLMVCAGTTRQNRNFLIAAVDIQADKLLSTIGKQDYMPLTISDDGTYLAVRDIQRGIRVVNSASGEFCNQIPLIENVRVAAFAPDSRSIYLGGVDHGVKRWNIPGGVLIKDFKFRQAKQWRTQLPWVCAICVSADGRRIANWEMAGPFRIHEVTTAEECLQNGARFHLISQCITTYTSDGCMIAVGEYDTTEWTQVHILDAHTGRSLKKWKVKSMDSYRGTMAFTPDGRRLITGGSDALVWDISDLAITQKDTLSPATQHQLWADLASDPTTAYKAIGKWITGKETVDYFKQVLKPVPQLFPDKISGLLTQLDDRNYSKRERAEKELSELGPVVVSHLQKLIAGQAPAEAKRRAEKIISTWEREALRQDRALEVLEAIGSAEARALLTEISKGDAAARLTQDAQAGFKRLERRPVPQVATP